MVTFPTFRRESAISCTLCERAYRIAWKSFREQNDVVQVPQLESVWRVDRARCVGFGKRCSSADLRAVHRGWRQRVYSVPRCGAGCDWWQEAGVRCEGELDGELDGVSLLR